MDTVIKFLNQVEQMLQDLLGSYTPYVLLGLGTFSFLFLLFSLIHLRFFHYNWEALKYLKRNGWRTFSSMSLVTITLILLGLFSSVMLNIEKVTRDVEGNVPIMVYLLEDSTDAKEAITDSEGKSQKNPNYHKVYDSIKSLKHVTSVSYSSKEEQLERYKDRLGEDWGTGNPLLDVYQVRLDSTKSLKSIKARIQELSDVESVDYGGADIEKLIVVTNYIRIGGLAGTMILLLIAIFLISNTVRLTIVARRHEIQIMRLVGAKNSYIKGPFFFEGAWIGLLGSIVPAILMFTIYNWMYVGMAPNFEQNDLSLYAPSFFVPSMIAAMTLTGVLIGSLGSSLSMRRFLKI